jgi:site-specific DNA-methyltransferase (cytosine-N4-specific)
MKHTLIKKHVLEALKDISDESIDCVVTSPPYYGLRSYKGAVAIWGGDTNCLHNFQETITHHDNLRFRGDNSSIGNEKNPEIHTSSDGIAASTTCSKCGAWKGQLGLELSYETYLGHLMLVTRELKRILKKSGTIFWNMGDSYAGNMGSRSGWQDSKYSESKEEGIENGESVFLKADYGKIGQKSLMMLPERFAIRMIDDGWILRNKLVWYKRNAMPSSVRDRFANKYEFVYFFSKAGKYYFNLDSVRKPLVEQRNKPFNIRVRDAKKGILEEKWGHLYSASEEEIKNYDEKKYHGKIPKGEEESFGSPRAREIRDFFNKKGQSGNFDYNEINSVSGTHYNEKGANPGDVLDVPTMPHKFAHFAIFPETLVEPLIKAGCPEDGTILDPFAGSGTVGTVARRLGRSSIMIEISKEYCEIIKERMQWGSGIAIEWKYVDDLHERYCHV